MGPINSTMNAGLLHGDARLAAARCNNLFIPKLPYFYHITN